MKQIINMLIIIFVAFSLCVETYMFIFGNLEISNLPKDVPSYLIYYYSYFTVLSNLTLATSAFILFMNSNYDSQTFRILRLDGLVCIIITSVVYNLILRQNHPPKGIMILTNELLHVVIPILGILGWLVYGPRPRVDKKTMFLAIFPPFIYVIYIFIRGEITNIYPYPFMDAGTIGIVQALLNTGIVMIIFIFLEFILFYTDQKLSDSSNLN
jgi:hypothetical protein